VSGLLTYWETMGALHPQDLGPLSIGLGMRTSIAGTMPNCSTGQSSKPPSSPALK